MVTDRRETRGRPLAEVVREACRGGVRAIQVREKNLSTRELWVLLEELLPIAEESGVSLLVNDRVDLVMALPLAGVHLAQASLPPAEVRSLLGPEKLIGVSCHSLVEALEAAEGGADFITLGPIFSTPSKAEYGPPQGVGILREVRSRVTLPLFAIGGITLPRVPEVMAAGADGVAAIRVIMAAPDVSQAVGEIRAAVEKGRKVMREN